MPDGGTEGREVGFAVFFVAVGAEERDGLAWEGDGGDEVSRLADWCGFGGGGVGGDCHAETWALDLADVDGEEGAGGTEEGNDVGAAGDRGKVERREGVGDVGES